MRALRMDANTSWYRGFIQGKTRITLAWIFAIALGVSAREYPVWPGVLLCFIGASLRFWASGYLRKDSRPAVGGPYGFVRNPLYLGTYCMALGTAWAAQSWVLLAVCTLLFASIYHFIILDEEVKLQRLFGQSYSRYCEAVARFFPRLSLAISSQRKMKLQQVNPDPTHHLFSYTLAVQNKAFEAFYSFLGLMGSISLVAYLWKAFS